MHDLRTIRCRSKVPLTIPEACCTLGGICPSRPLAVGATGFDGLTNDWAVGGIGAGIERGRV